MTTPTPQAAETLSAPNAADPPATVTIELPDNGQEFELPVELAGDDDFIRKFLAPHYPDVANAKIERESDNGITTRIKVIKRAGPKANVTAALITALNAAQPHVNAAVDMCIQLGATPDAQTLIMTQCIHPAAAGRGDWVSRQADIDEAIRAGAEEANQVQASLSSLARAAAAPAHSVPTGF